MRSKASIAGHPLHPMIVPFPIAFLIGALVTDIVFASGGTIFWARASEWLLIAGLVMGVIAALLGLTDFLGIDEVRDHRIAWFHFIGNATILVVEFINLLLRLGNVAAGVLPWGLLLSVVATGGLLVTGWLGGELAYRHGIGVSGREEYRIGE